VQAQEGGRRRGGPVSSTGGPPDGGRRITGERRTSAPRYASRQGAGSLGRRPPRPCPAHAARLGGVDRDLPRLGGLCLGQRYGEHTALQCGDDLILVDLLTQCKLAKKLTKSYSRETTSAGAPWRACPRMVSPFCSTRTSRASYATPGRSARTTSPSRISSISTGGAFYRS
jgi:hypothetical protein